VVVAADYGAWRVDYADHSGGWPRTVRIRSAEPGRVDATARIEQLEINTAIEDRAFTLTVPGDAERITLQDLIAIAPLRGPS
jgi:outer membrane lipoprotein-sorting protein